MQKTIKFATDMHFGQTRKGNGLPYIVHPMEVMLEARNCRITDLDVLKACVVHDVAEDVPNLNHDEFREIVGDRAYGFVEELTFVKTPTFNKEDYLKSFKTKSIESIFIKLIDRICNVKDFYMDGDKKYALIYWNKAESVVNAWNERKNEMDIQVQEMLDMKILNMEYVLREPE